MDRILYLGIVDNKFTTSFLLEVGKSNRLPGQLGFSTDSSWIKLKEASCELERLPRGFEIIIDARELEGGRAYAGKITITAHTKDNSSASIIYYILFGTKKTWFWDSLRVEQELEAIFSSLISSEILHSQYSDDVLEHVEVAQAKGNLAGEAAAYTHIVWAKLHPDFNTQIDLRRPMIDPVTSSHPAYPYVQQWHRIVHRLPYTSVESLGFGWDNWDPHIPLGIHEPFRMIPLWALSTSKIPRPVEELRNQSRVLLPFSSEVGVDALTGVPVKIIQPPPALPLIGAGQISYWGRKVVTDGFLTVHVNGRRLIAEEAGNSRVLWKSTNVGGILDLAHQVIMGKELVYLQSGNKIAAFDKSTGLLAWEDKLKTNFEWGYGVQFTESNGLLIAIYLMKGKDQIDPVELNMTWWITRTGKGQTKNFKPRRDHPLYLSQNRITPNDLYFCYAVAPIGDIQGTKYLSGESSVKPNTARVLIAYTNKLYDIRLEEDKAKETYRNLNEAYPEHLYMHVFGEICFLVSQGRDGILLTAKGLGHHQPNNTISDYPAYFSKEEDTTFRLGTNVQRRNVLFDFSIIGGVLILRPRFKAKGSLLALI
ncbi:MAG: hypothetical protein KJ077_27895 [Anaerolineae bacterium]|nr:hypothetical protein [Anaerolineae bacterium]